MRLAYSQLVWKCKNKVTTEEDTLLPKRTKLIRKYYRKLKEKFYRSVFGVTMSEALEASIVEGVTSIQLDDISTRAHPQTDPSSTGKPKKKVIHFADGSTLEDDDDDDAGSAESNSQVDAAEKVTKSVVHSTEAVPDVDPSKLNWPQWMRHQGSRVGSKTLSVLEGMGGTAAYYLGITTPKYQSEIDEYNRMMIKKKSQEEELMSWSSSPQPPQQQPVVEEVKKEEKISQ